MQTIKLNQEQKAELKELGIRTGIGLFQREVITEDNEVVDVTMDFEFAEINYEKVPLLFESFDLPMESPHYYTVNQNIQENIVDLLVALKNSTCDSLSYFIYSMLEMSNHFYEVSSESLDKLTDDLLDETLTLDQVNERTKLTSALFGFEFPEFTEDLLNTFREDPTKNFVDSPKLMYFKSYVEESNNTLTE